MRLTDYKTKRNQRPLEKCINNPAHIDRLFEDRLCYTCHANRLSRIRHSVTTAERRGPLGILQEETNCN